MNGSPKPSAGPDADERLPPSLWTAADIGPRYPSLDAGHETDVAVIGGGIVGLTAALLLQDAGLAVTVIESQRIGRQVTGRSTAKVTSQHGLKYHDLTKTYGVEAARLYAEANQDAIRAIEQRAGELGIDCAFEARIAYTYATDRGMVSTLHDEVSAAREIGLPASFTSTVRLPYEVAGAVAFTDQAQFDPYAYLVGLAERVAERGTIFEQTRVTDVDEGEPCRITTAGEQTVTARKVIVASHLPMLDRGLYFARTKPRGHSVIAARLDGPPLDGMFLSADSPTRSLRSFEDDGGAWLILLGDAYTPGEVDTAATLAELEAHAREHFPVTTVEHRWTNEDYDSVDGLPLVGPLLPTSEHVSIATGFSAWGITNGVVAAQILADGVLGRLRPVGELFSTNRFTPKASARETASEVAATVKGLADRFLPDGPLDLDAIGRGEAAVGDLHGERAAVSRGYGGALHAVSAICTHKGCLVGWNSAMRTWDCPCHGSSFSRDGTVLHGPAVQNLARVDLEESEAP